MPVILSWSNLIYVYILRSHVVISRTNSGCTGPVFAGVFASLVVCLFGCLVACFGCCSVLACSLAFFFACVFAWRGSNVKSGRAACHVAPPLAHSYEFASIRYGGNLAAILRIAIPIQRNICFSAHAKFLSNPNPTWEWRVYTPNGKCRMRWGAVRKKLSPD